MSKSVKSSKFIISYVCKYCDTLKSQENMTSGKMCKKCSLKRVTREKQQITQKAYYQKNKEKKILYQREYRKKQKLLKAIKDKNYIVIKK